MNEEKLFKVTVKALICKDDKILLALDEKGKWEMLGGKIDFGETPIEALTRELEEEVKIVNPSIKEVIHASSFVIPEKNLQYVVIVYEVALPEGDLVMSSEHVKLDWISVNDISSLSMRDVYKDAIHKYLEGSS